MKLGEYRFRPKGRYFSPNPEPRTMSDVRRERNVVLMVIVLVVILSVGIPFLANLGKSIFGITPVIY